MTENARVEAGRKLVPPTTAKLKHDERWRGLLVALRPTLMMATTICFAKLTDPVELTDLVGKP
jgi:hypothetical protein